MISSAPTWDFTMHSGQYRARVVPEGRGYRAELISVGFGAVMESYGDSPTEALTILVRELYDTESVLERKLARDIARHTALPIVLESPARSVALRSAIAGDSETQQDVLRELNRKYKRAFEEPWRMLAYLRSVADQLGGRGQRDSDRFRSVVADHGRLRQAAVDLP